MSVNNTAKATLTGQTLTVELPVTFRRVGGRKRVVVPEGAQSWAPRHLHIDNSLVKAIARAHRWQRMLESGEYGSAAELARAEKINSSYLARVLRLTLLAPHIVEAALDGKQSAECTLAQLMKPFPAIWKEQHAVHSMSA